jgi:hypothetical protein
MSKRKILTTATVIAIASRIPHLMHYWPRSSMYFSNLYRITWKAPFFRVLFIVRYFSTFFIFRLCSLYANLNQPSKRTLGFKVENGKKHEWGCWWAEIRMSPTPVRRKYRSRIAKFPFILSIILWRTRRKVWITRFWWCRTFFAQGYSLFYRVLTRMLALICVYAHTMYRLKR